MFESLAPKGEMSFPPPFPPKPSSVCWLRISFVFELARPLLFADAVFKPLVEAVLPPYLVTFLFYRLSGEFIAVSGCTLYSELPEEFILAPPSF